MGFNFGAFLGGAASQIVEDIDEQEKEVKLRTRTILDRQVAEAAENRKKFQDDKEKVEKQITSIAQLFDPNDPFRFNKARSIVAGGDEHYNTMYKELSTHKRLGGDMNQAYSYTSANEEQGFKGVADAAKGLAKLRTISAPEFTESVRSKGAKLFGIDSKSMYEKAKAQYEQAGLLPSSKEEFKDSVKKYGTGTINFQNLKKEVKDVQTMYAQNTSAILALDKNDPKYAEKRAKLEKDNKILTEQVANMNNVSSSVLAEKLRQEGKDTGRGYTELKNGFKDSRRLFRLTLGDVAKGTVVGDDGEPILDEQEAQAFINNKMKAWDKTFVNKLVDGNGDLIDTGDDMKNFISDFNLGQYVGKPKEEEDKVDKSKTTTFEDKVKSAQDAGSPEAFLQGELGKINKGLSSERKNKIYQKIFEIVQNAYPNAPNIQEIVNKEIDKYEAAQKAKTFVRNKGDVADNTEKPIILDDKGEEIINPNFKYSGAI
tara:strand:+ start:2611 stop:4065 length:1455 start_codon:yes stop_codon:yes gene_type:complete